MKGSIVERGKDKGNKNGKMKTYAVVIDMGRDENGKRKQKWFSGYKTKREAEKALNEILYKVQNRVYCEGEEMTLRQYLDDWLEIHKSSISQSTYVRYKFLIKNITTHLGTKKLKELRPLIIKNFYSELRKSLSDSTIRKVHRMLHLALQNAVECQIIHTNCIHGMRGPKVKDVELNVWDLETIQCFKEKIKEEKIYTAVVIALDTGMREGEIAGLRWEDIDLSNKKIFVRHTLQQDKETKKLILKEPKTEKSKRSISLMDSTVNMLRVHFDSQQKNENLFGAINNNFVCCWDDGRPLDPMYICKRFKKLVERYQFPKVTFHSTRHTHASLLFRQGVHPKIVQERLGHSSIRITLDTYSHLIPNMQDEAVEKLSELFDDIKKDKPQGLNESC